MVRILKAIWEAFKWGLVPTCDHDAGVCLKGQGKGCRFKEDDPRNIQRKNYHFKNEVK